MKLGGVRRWALAVGGGAVIVAAVTVLGNNGTAPAAGTAAGPTRRPPARAREEPVPVSDLKLELLHRSPPGVEEPSRNPFRFQERLAAAPAKALEPSASRGATPPPPPRPVASAPAGPPAAPAIPLRYIGVVDAPTQSGRLAILSDGRGNVFQGKEGDTIEGRYRVLKIGPETVDLAHVDGRGQQTIRLSGQ